MEQGTQIKSGAPSFPRTLRKGWESTPIPGRLLPRAFFADAPERVAPRLLGKLLVHRAAEGVLAGRIVEVEAYLGPHNTPPDPAAHSFRGPTPRNAVLFGPAGHAYVYAIYGMYFCMNLSCDADGRAGCVLVRALEPVLGLAQMAVRRGVGPDAAPRLLTSGPGRLCQALGLTRSEHNGLDVTSRRSLLQVRDDGARPAEALVTPRIGIRHAVDWPLRFSIPGNPCVSGAKNPAASRIRLE